jgi:predicted nucleic acid-binding protein
MNRHLADHEVCTRALRHLYESDHLPCFTLQNATEFWNVSTRPRERNGFGLSVPETSTHLDEIASTMAFLPDNARVFEGWRRLVVSLAVRGIQVHDAKLAASMIVHRVRQILTFNTADFARFRDVEAVHPASLL